MTAQLIPTESEAVDLIARIHNLRSAANASTKAEKPLAAQLRQYLELEDCDELIDGERGLRAYLEPRSSTEWNVSRMPPGVVLYLAQAGLLTVDTKQFDLRRKNDGAVELDDAKRYRMDKAGSSYALQIKSTKSDK